MAKINSRPTPAPAPASPTVEEIIKALTPKSQAPTSPSGAAPSTAPADGAAPAGGAAPAQDKPESAPESVGPQSSAEPAAPQDQVSLSEEAQQEQSAQA